MSTIFSRDKVPFFLAVLFSMTSWIVIHLNDRLLVAPIVKYSIGQTDTPNGHEFVYRIKNITMDKALSDLTFFISKDYRDSPDANSDSIYSADVIYYPPIKIVSTQDILEYGPSFVKSHLSQLQPGAYFEITLRKRKDAELPLRILAPGAVYLSRDSTQTFLVEHELTILSIIAVVCIVLLVVYMVFLKPESCIENSH